MKSMTGFGSCYLSSKRGKLAVEIQSLNRKFLDISMLLPKEFYGLEANLRKEIKKFIFRGQVTVKISFFSDKETITSFLPDLAFLKELKKKLYKISEELSVSTESIDLPFLLKVSDVLFQKEVEKDLYELIFKGLASALKNLLKAKEEEGAIILKDIKKRLKEIEKKVFSIEKRAPFCVKIYREKLKKKLQELSLEVDEDRILKEAAIFSEKVDVTEEIVRLKSHIKLFLTSMLSKKEPCGKKLDFILQEMMREISTISAKSLDVTISKCVIEIKGELEKIREQIQNVE